jgi:hypothetical protein
VDWRGAGGYVVAPPSRHASGAAYTWIRRPGGNLPGGPATLRELIAGPAIFHDDRPIAHPDRYAAAALEAEVDRVAHAVVGTRNDTLNRAAFALGRLVGAGLLDAGLVASELSRAARWAGLGRVETRRTIRSGLTAGRRQPVDQGRAARDPGKEAGRSVGAAQGVWAARERAGRPADRANAVRVAEEGAGRPAGSASVAGSRRAAGLDRQSGGRRVA